MKLLECTKSAGCATKYPPKDMFELTLPLSDNPNILAGKNFNDDGYVINCGGTNLIQSVDILAPIVNDPYDFGRIAMANAISDIYAMGGRPFTAMNISCFPEMTSQNKGVLQAILNGGFSILEETFTILAGGHTVTDENIKYGAAITGIAGKNITVNSGLKVGDYLILTKPIGIGVLVTALKSHIVPGKKEKDIEKIIVNTCTQLNSIGYDIIQNFNLSACTDITGFGLGGHIIEMAIASNVTVKMYSIPLLPCIKDYDVVANRTIQNYQAFKNFCDIHKLEYEYLFDPQTSGGLVLAVPETKIPQIQNILKDNDYTYDIVGHVTEKQEKYLVD